MKSGDLIEWYYKHNNKTVILNELLWSSLMFKWIPLCSISVLLYQDKEIYSWINLQGSFHIFCARIEDKVKAKPSMIDEETVLIRIVSLT